MSKWLLDCSRCICSCCSAIFFPHRLCFLAYFAGLYFPVRCGVPLVHFLRALARFISLFGLWYVPSFIWYSCSVAMCRGNMSGDSCSPPRANAVATYCACPFVFIYGVSNLSVPRGEVIFWYSPAGDCTSVDFSSYSWF